MLKLQPSPMTLCATPVRGGRLGYPQHCSRCLLINSTQVKSRLPEMVHMLFINLQLFCNECLTATIGVTGPYFHS